MLGRVLRVAALAALLAVLLPVSPASAEQAAPSARAEFPAEWLLVPGAVESVMSSPPVRLRVPAPGVSEFTLTDSDGVLYPLVGRPMPVDGIPDLREVRLPLLPQGTYALSWSSAAGQEQVRFTLQLGLRAPETPPPPEPSASSPLWLLALVVGSLGAVGSVILWRRGRRFPALAVAGGVSVLAVGSAFVVPVLAAPDLSGVGSSPQDEVTRCVVLGEQRSECLSSLIVSAFDRAGAPAAAELLRALDSDPRLAVGGGDHPCHEAAHFAGQDLVRSGTALVELVTDELGSCATGLIHGAVEGWAPLASDAQVREFLPVACTPLTDPAVREQCFHGLGHAAGMRFNSALPQTFEVCAAIEDSWEAGLCLQGAGMEASTRYVIGLLNNGVVNPHWLPPGLSETPARYCEDFSGVLRERCFSGAFWYLHAGQYGGDRIRSLLPEEVSAERMLEWCMGLDPDAAPACAHGVGIGVSDPATSSVPWEQKALSCAALLDLSLRTACAMGLHTNAVQDSLGRDPLPALQREAICRAAAAGPECVGVLGQPVGSVPLESAAAWSRALARV